MVLAVLGFSLVANVTNAFDFYGIPIADKEVPSSLMRVGIIGIHPILGEVPYDSLAGKSGFKTNDIVLSINGKEVKSVSEISSFNADILLVTVHSLNERRTLSVKNSDAVTKSEQPDDKALIIPEIPDSNNAIDSTRDEVNKLIKEYGKDKIINFISRHRNGTVSIIDNGHISEMSGPPDSQYVNTNTITRDFSIIRTTPSDVKKVLMAENSVKARQLAAKKAKAIFENAREIDIQNPELIFTDVGMRLFLAKSINEYLSNVKKGCLPQVKINHDVQKYNECAKEFLVVEYRFYLDVLAAGVKSGFLDIARAAEYSDDKLWPRVFK